MGGVEDVRSPQDLQAAVASGKPVVLHFWAGWCEPCSHMDAVLAQLAADLPDISCMRVEAEAVDEVTLQHGVTTVPCFVFLRGGQVVDRLEGADPPALTAKATALARAGGGATTSTSTASSTPAQAVTAAGAGAGAEGGPAAAVFGRIKFLLERWPVLLCMKGSPEAPRCGFSRRVVEALGKLGVAFKSVDILTDEALRQGLKEYSNWPTYPQLYVKGELVGGCDIVSEMAGSGELEGLLRDKLGADFKAVAAAAVAEAAPATGAAPVAPPTTTTTAAPPSSAPSAAAPAAESPDSVRQRIRSLLSGPQPVLLCMKGSPEAPRCGFSRRVVEALKAEGVEFGSVDILTDEALRQGLKEYSNWPTYPQLYVRGELVGGCDIVAEMAGSGELGSTIQEMLHRMDVP